MIAVGLIVAQSWLVPLVWSGRGDHGLGLSLLTPLLLFAAGATVVRSLRQATQAARNHRERRTTMRWLVTRLLRFALPVAAFVVVWAPLSSLLTASDLLRTTDAGGVAPRSVFEVLRYPVTLVSSPVNLPVWATVALTVAELGLVLAMRPMISRWATTPVVARGLALVHGRLLTIYLWHLPALVLVSAANQAAARVAAVAGHQTPGPLDPGQHPQWWLAALVVVLAGLVRAFGRFERPGAAGRADAVERADTPGQADTPGRADAVERAGAVERADNHERAGAVGRADAVGAGAWHRLARMAAVGTTRGKNRQVTGSSTLVEHRRLEA